MRYCKLIFYLDISSEIISHSVILQDYNICFYAFEIRHRFTHDANYSLKFDKELLSDIEEFFQILPQVFIQDIASRYSMNRFVFQTEKLFIRLTDRPEIEEKPYIFSAAEFIAIDWQIVENETSPV